MNDTDEKANALALDQVDGHSSPFVQATLAQSRSQFGILDLILFTTGVAVGFTFMTRPNNGVPTIPVMYVVYSLLSGFTLGSFFLLVRQRFNGHERFLQPGVLLLLVAGIETLLHLILFQLSSLYFGKDAYTLESGSAQTIWYVASYATVGIIGMALFVWAITRVTTGWKIVLLFCAIGRIASASSLACMLIGDRMYRLMSVLSTVGQSAVLVAMIICVVCAIFDFQKNRQQGLLHWAGIASLVAFGTMPFLQMLLSRFMTTEQLYGV